MGRRHKGRAVHGILLLDKDADMSSNQALQRIKRLYGAAKAGHTGSLDPLATGMLPICFGEATKLSGHLLDADKRYEVSLRLGQATDTADADGQIIAESDCSGIDRAAVEAALPGFLGEIEQIPPMYSAVKHEGQRLYKIARQGREVERKPRRITIHALELLDCGVPSLRLRVDCSKGTYIRTLVEDLAAVLGTHAHVTALRRTRLGPFQGEMWREADLTTRAAEQGQQGLDALLLPPQTALAGWPRVSLDADSSFYFRRGQAVQVRAAPTQGQLAVFGPDERLLGLGEIDDDGRVAPRRLLELRPKSP